MLTRVDFPRTSVVVSHTSRTGLSIKGIRSTSHLREAIAKISAESEDGRALVQTDMRANHNPRRMQTIAKAASQLSARLFRSCPECGAYGWGLLGVERGLPCAGCGEPTELVLYQLEGCTACHSAERLARPDGLLEADPAQCQHCNP